jgi:hypothetical protein
MVFGQYLPLAHLFKLFSIIIILIIILLPHHARLHPPQVTTRLL